MPKLSESAVSEIKAELVAGDRQQEIADRRGVSRSIVSDIATERAWKQVPWPAKYSRKKPLELNEQNVLLLLRRSPATTAELAVATKSGKRAVAKLVKAMQARGALIFEYGDKWTLEKAPAAASGDRHTCISNPAGEHRFGFLGDTHLGSKYERLDVLHDLYEKFAAAGVTQVFHAGNWIDGDARFNRHDLHTHGMDAQIRYLIDNYPQKPGMTTYSVAGDDHEGWYGQREGIDIGKHAARMFVEAGRQDWKHLGYMEAFIGLRHAKSRAESQLLLMHPGGGSSYATSYRPQKIVESFAGGEKPAVLLLGHYHKLSLLPVRNCWTVQCGCTQDQTPFMRKKSIDAHVGGGICELQQDEQGAIIGCKVEFFTYYNRGYYNNRWSHGGPVQLPNRGVK